MPLQAGARLGAYEILAPIDAAGATGVYKASDTLAGRTVTIRVLTAQPDAPEARQRFERQAQTLAALQHPHIGTLHEIGHQDGVDFVVSEYFEGQRLAERLKGKPLDLDEALAVGLAVASALDAAHRAGVLHRNLNPASVMLTQSGPKLLDFGLSELPSSSPVGASQTEVGRKPEENPGLPYTAPELLDGKPADARADLFAFGAVLYEMIAGKRAFEGKSRAVLVAAITTEEPDPLCQVQPKAPRTLQHIVQRCLAKDPDDRWQTAHDMLVQLRWVTEGGVPGAISGRATEGARLTRVLLAAGVLLVAALAYPALRYFRGAGAQEAFQIRVPVRGLNVASHAISPDGQTIAMVARPNSQEPSALYVRRVGSVTFQRLGGTDDAAQPFWSADNRVIAFVAGGRLKKVGVAGGAPQDIGEVQGFSGGTWNREGTILFGSAKGVFRVSAEGGKPAAVTTPAAPETGHYWPDFLPDGRHFLYLAWSGQAGNRAVFVGDVDSKQTTRLLAADSNPAYAAPGYVLFHREASLFAQPFDAKKLVLTGEPVHVADEVSSTPASGRGNFSVSQEGTLLYFQGANAPAGRGQTNIGVQFGWVDRTGNIIAPAGEAGPYGDMDLSPDGKLIAVTKQEAGSPGADIWVIDWQRAGVSTRLTLDPADDLNPVWSPDGTRIAFTTYRKGNADIYVKNANGVGAETPLLDGSNDEIVKDWSKDGSYIAYLSGQDNFQDIYVLPLSGDKKPFPVVQGRFQKNEPQFSYDGKWLAYTSDESGMFQVYVISFPAADQKLQVSMAGGGQPRWRKDGKELYFRAPDNRIMVVDIHAGAKLESGSPRVLFFPQMNNFMTRDPVRHQLAVTPDGQRFLFRVPPTFGGNPGGRGGAPSALPVFIPPGQTGAAAPTQPNLAGLSNGLTVIQHWTAALGKAEK